MSLTVSNMVNTGVNLFSTTNNNATGGIISLAADYNSLKNGSYGKLLKSYYDKLEKEDGQDAKSKTSAEQKELSNIKSESASLKEAADALLTKGDKSLFEKKEVTASDGTKSMQYDMDAIYKAVSKYADAYNNLVDSGQDSSDTGVLIQTASLVTGNTTNANMLSKIGISIDKDHHMMIDETYFKTKADVNDIKSLFNTHGSLAYNAQTRASAIETYAKNTLSGKTGYTNSGLKAMTSSEMMSSFTTTM